MPLAGSKWSSLRHAINETNFMLPENNHFLRVHRFLPETEVEGPGRRAALWVQGCPIQCPGCANGATWSFDGGNQINVENMFGQIRKLQNIEGVTFIGGEPFSQARALAALGQLCREHGLSVVTFTGYEHSRLVDGRRKDWNALLAVTDLLLAGPFLEDQKDCSRPWVGSRNQEFVFLTNRYRHLQEQGFSLRNGLEIQIASDGGVRLNGLAPVEDIASFRQELALLGLQTN
jgi:anaerobic ribonucleoside-triphosphate reductase activating protein